MRQLIIAAIAVIALTAASSAIALRTQAQSVAQCSALVAGPPCLKESLKEEVPLQL
jgi:hypothetical protein